MGYPYQHSKSFNLAGEIHMKHPSAEDLEWEKKHVWHPYASFSNPTPVNYFKSAQGVWINADSPEGRSLRLVDGLSSWWCAAFGYDHPRLIKALKEAVSPEYPDSVRHVMFAGFTHQPAIEAARLLLKLAPKSMDKVFFCDSGSVAVEIALKMAIQYQAGAGRRNRTKFACLKGGYHGDTWHTMAVSQSSDAGMHDLYSSLLPSAYALEAPETPFEAAELSPLDEARIDELFRLRADELAAVVVEPIFQGAHGMRFYSPLYLKKLARSCRENGVLLIFDEIATGFGRLGSVFASELSGVDPDLMTVGKALTGGTVSLAAVLASEATARCMENHSSPQFMHGPTFMANGIACSAAAAAMRLFIEEDMTAKSKKLQTHLQGLKQRIDAAENPLIKSCRTLGSIIALEYLRPIDRDAFTQKAASLGLWLRPIGSIQYAMPPFVIVDDEEALEVFLSGFEALAADCSSFLVDLK